jgi:hypothetical protein
MLTTLNTAYTDTRAGDLTWSLGREPLPALAVLDLEHGPVRLQLRLLGASHQVMLRCPGLAPWSETVACLPGARAPLPVQVSGAAEGWEYEFAALVETAGRAAFATRAQELTALVQSHPHALLGTFPGDRYAFTALLAEPEGDRLGRVGRVGWRTWHAYPQEGRLVCTRSRVAPLGTRRLARGSWGVGVESGRRDE